MSRISCVVLWLLMISFFLLCAEVARTDEPKNDESYYESEEFQKARKQLARLGVEIWTLVPDEYVDKPGDAYGCTVTIYPNDHVTDDDLAVLPDLNPIAHLNIQHPAITKEGLEVLKDIHGLRQIYLACAEGPYVRAGVTDEIIAHLADDRHLELINMKGTRLVHGETMKLFQEHCDLKSLWLGEALLTEEGMRQIGTLTQLETLILFDCNVTDDGAKHLTGMENLQTLVLHENPLFGHGLAALEDAPNLTALYLSHCFLSDEGTASLGKLKSLEILVLNDNQISDRTLEHLAAGELKKLRDLELRRTDEGMKYLASLPNLQFVSLSETSVTGLGMKHLAGAKNLASIDLRLTDLTDENVQGLKHLTQVSALTLDGTRITDAAIPVLSKLNQLEHLSISHTGITKEGIDTLRQALPECEIDNSEYEYETFMQRIMEDPYYPL